MDTTTKNEVAKNEEHEKVKERIAELRKGKLEAIDLTVLDSIEKRIAQRWPVGPVRLGILARMEREAAERAKAKPAEPKPPVAEPAPEADEDPVPVGRGGGRSPGKR